MQLIFKRTKIFLSHTPDGGERRYVGTIGPDGRAPSWIAETNTYKLGIKDESIINLKAVAEAQEAETEAEQEDAAPQVQPKIPAGNIRALSGKVK